MNNDGLDADGWVFSEGEDAHGFFVQATLDRIIYRQTLRKPVPILGYKTAEEHMPITLRYIGERTNKEKLLKQLREDVSAGTSYATSIFLDCDGNLISKK